MQQLDPLAQADNDFRPLIKSLLENPVYRRMYLAHIRTILEENFANVSLYRPRILELQGLIASAVIQDDKKFYSNFDFVNNVDQALNPNDIFSLVPGVTDLMTGRYAYLSTHPALSPAAPVIGNVSDLLDGEVYVSATVSNASSISLYFRYDSSGIFQSLPMLDDGLHHDGAAGDGIFGQSFAYNGIVAQYYIYAENGSAGKFSPQRAEHEFYTATLNPPNPTGGDIVINEFLASNNTAETDEAGQTEDWIELYNDAESPASLNGFYLTDDATKPDKWLFPLGTTIPAKGFLIVWADEDQSQGPLHASFKLGAGGEFLMLSNGAGGVIDSLSFGPQKADTTYGRYPNGTGPFVFMPRTFNAANSASSGVDDITLDASLRLFPNPVLDILSIQSDQALGLIRVSDALGREVLRRDVADFRNTALDLKVLPTGFYFIKIGTRAPERIVVRHP